MAILGIRRSQWLATRTSHVVLHPLWYACAESASPWVREFSPSFTVDTSVSKLKGKTLIMWVHHYNKFCVRTNIIELDLIWTALRHMKVYHIMHVTYMQAILIPNKGSRGILYQLVYMGWKMSEKHMHVDVSWRAESYKTAQLWKRDY